MKSKRFIPALGAFFVLIALVISGCGSSGVPDGAVATMAGNPISLKSLNHWMFVAAKEQAAQSPGQPVIVPNDPPNFSKCLSTVRAEIPALKKTSDKQLRADCKQLFTTLKAQVMDFLIKAYWYQADAHKMGIKVTDKQVQTALAAAKKGQFSTPAQFQAFLTSTGQTVQDVTYRVRIQQIYTKLLAKHPTTVSNAQIAAYYNSHQSQFGTPELRDLKIVLTKTQAQAAKALSALKSGHSWTQVAKQYSTDPTTKNKGGVLLNVSKGQQDAALSSAAFSATPNKLLGPIKGQFGYYVLEVTKITPAKTRTLAQSSALIKQTLLTQLQTAAQTAVNNHAKQDWLSKTQCKATYAMADCSGYKAPKIATSAVGAGAAGAAGAGTTPAG
ncbi:MAG TPA: peptidyl-prolyl cis-trans isomerase [Solirubrobacteraceae bacterium]|nr:peptidyl-prolyl cis-trans isomerase [Solirubrobacteraceae bacterium]